MLSRTTTPATHRQCVRALVLDLLAAQDRAGRLAIDHAAFDLDAAEFGHAWTELRDDGLARGIPGEALCITNAGRDAHAAAQSALDDLADRIQAAAYTLSVDGIVQDDESDLLWADALRIIWDGSYNAGALTLLDARSTDVTVDALRHLAERTFLEQETPAHLAELFHWHRLAHFGLTDSDHDEAFQREVSPFSVALGRRRAIFGAYSAEG